MPILPSRWPPSVSAPRWPQRGLELVYGGASVGLMGVVADAALAAGGRATGVITESLAGHEIAHQTLSDLHVVSTMHERKALMSDLSDAFVMLPGGFGTYEEFMESVTWAQLGIHDKPCGILNVDGFFDDLLGFVRHAAAQGFIKSRQIDALVISDDVDELLDGAGRCGERSGLGSVEDADRSISTGASERTGKQQHVAQLVGLAPVGQELGHGGVGLLRTGLLLQERRRVAQLLEGTQILGDRACPKRGAAFRPSARW